MTEAVAKANYKWRVVDIVVAAIIAVASGVIFWGWDIVCSAPLALFEGVTPGFEGRILAVRRPARCNHCAQARCRTVCRNPRRLP